MKYIKVKDDIQVLLNGEPWKDSDGSVMKPWSFSQYLERIVLADPSIGTGYKELKSCFTIEDQFKKAASGDWVVIDEEHWNMLKSTIENPKGGGISPSILRQFIPFMDAVLEAKSEKPH